MVAVCAHSAAFYRSDSDGEKPAVRAFVGVACPRVLRVSAAAAKVPFCLHNAMIPATGQAHMSAHGGLPI